MGGYDGGGVEREHVNDRGAKPGRRQLAVSCTEFRLLVVLWIVSERLLVSPAAAVALDALATALPTARRMHSLAT